MSDWKLKTHYVECECSSFHHIGRFVWYEKDDKIDWDEELYFNFIVSNYLPWYKRIWYAIRYVLGEDDCSYDCLIMSKEKTKELRDFLTERLGE